eukprot:3720457-Rhodomonas_salina.1
MQRKNGETTTTPTVYASSASRCPTSRACMRGSRALERKQHNGVAVFARSLLNHRQPLAHLTCLDEGEGVCSSIAYEGVAAYARSDYKSKRWPTSRAWMRGSRARGADGIDIACSSMPYQRVAACRGHVRQRTVLTKRRYAMSVDMLCQYRTSRTNAERWPTS